MVLPPDKLPSDVAEQQAMVRHFTGEVDKRDAVIARQQDKLSELQAEIQLLLARRFGSSSEKVNEAQLGLFNEAEYESDAAPDDGDDDADSGDGEHQGA